METQEFEQMKISRATFVAKLPAESAALRVEPADLSVTLENVKFLSFRERNRNQ